jgi:Cu+-exporting ATPase
MHVQKAAGKVPGVESASVNLATETLTVQYDESKVPFETLQKAVEQAGYGLVKPQEGKRAEIGVEGMTCASCSSAVERAIKRLDGVTEASVNLATNRRRLPTTPRKSSSRRFARPFPKRVCARELKGEESRDLEQERREKERKRMKARLIVAIAFALPILYIAMGQCSPRLACRCLRFYTPWIIR